MKYPMTAGGIVGTLIAVPLTWYYGYDVSTVLMLDTFFVGFLYLWESRNEDDVS